MPPLSFLLSLLALCVLIGAQDICEPVSLFKHAHCPLPSRLLSLDHPIISLSRDHDRLQKDLEDTYRNGGQILKEYFYDHGNWDSVARKSPQTDGDLDLLYQHMPHIVGKLESSSIIFELGPSTYMKKSRAILDALEATGFHYWYVLVEYNQDIISKIEELQKDYSRITFIVICGDFDQAFPIARELAYGRTAALISLGSTYTNAERNVLGNRFGTWGSIVSAMGASQDLKADDWHKHYHSPEMMKFIFDAFKRADKIIGKTLFSDSTELECRLTPTSHAYRFRLNNGKIIEVFPSIKSNEAAILDPSIHQPMVFSEVLGAESTTMSKIIYFDNPHLREE
ncbi:hypothetical protein B0I35DRAFT_445157 [Stachybotrys elegans]|uniref:Histidine-specific methyltransferase SAM-dependent domain-containing protein n=1 Tax=Stachybotrys elegans TaxID=80388 RepID=A0A8K0WJJ4_9HYPO|nr:hypothetical protein B0I35DRAFT_445157 [Stachybotrys elegans]